MRKQRKAPRAVPPTGSPPRALLGTGLTIRALEIFVVVAKAGTMTGAARELNMSQPAISQTIASLEQSLGVQLFDRSVRPPVLTLQGTTLIKHAATITETVRQFRSTVRLGTSAQLPLLRIGVSNSFAVTVGPHIFRQLRNIAAEWVIDSGFHATRFRTVIDRDFDFVITADQSTVPPEVEATPILTEPFVVVVPRTYDRATSLQKISTELDHIRLGRDPTLHARFDQALARHGATLQKRFHLDTAEAVLAMVAAGSGWTIMPPLGVIKSLERGAPIRALPFPGKPFHRTINIVSLKNESATIAQQIRRSSIQALNKYFMPSLRKLMPEAAKLTTLHDE